MMNRRVWTRTLGAGALMGSLPWLPGCAAPAAGEAPASATPESGVAMPGTTPPALPREFRAAWVATVANIDWPSKPGLPVAQQRSEMVAILDRAQSLRLNAIVLQVRPAADAIYPSSLEPWSEYLTGEQGKAPDPYWDPLRTWIDEAHRRGLELHAWLNPYRAAHPSAKSALAPTHLARTHPHAVKRYGEFLWMDPAEPEALQRTLDVLADLVRRYDLDGVHIDDYFYPYPIQAIPPGGTEKVDVDFPDEPAWQRYTSQGGTLARADWRREQVNRLVEGMVRTVQALKPWVKVGISPFGIGRPDRRPPGIAGFSQYDKLYADAELWLEKGWLDYFTPQLYWPISQTAQAYGTLLDYWVGQNPLKRHIWPGLYTSSVARAASGTGGAGTGRQWEPEEILNQIQLTRTRPAAGGHVHFSMVALMQDRKGLATQLESGLYAQPALVPSTPWLAQGVVPPVPRLTVRRADAAGQASACRREGIQVEIKVAASPAMPLAQVALWARHGAQWTWQVLMLPPPLPGATDHVLLAERPLRTDDGPLSMLDVRALDRVGQEGPSAQLSTRDWLC